MAKLNFAHLCENAFVSTEGNLSMVQIFENIQTDTIPAKHPRMDLVLEISEITEPTNNLKVKLIGPNGSQLRKPLLIPFGNDQVGIFRQIIRIVDLELEQIGVHKIVIFVNEIELGTNTFDVKSKTS